MEKWNVQWVMESKHNSWEKQLGVEGDDCSFSQSLCMHFTRNKYCIKYWCNPYGQAQTHCSKLQCKHLIARLKITVLLSSAVKLFFTSSRALQQQKTASNLWARHLSASDGPRLIRQKRTLNPIFLVLHECSTTEWFIKRVWSSCQSMLQKGS